MGPLIPSLGRLSPVGVADQLFEEEKPMKKYQCEVCGYIYDPAEGDPEANIPPNTPFEDLPADWVCPICGATKDQFTPVD